MMTSNTDEQVQVEYVYDRLLIYIYICGMLLFILCKCIEANNLLMFFVTVYLNNRFQQIKILKYFT